MPENPLRPCPEGARNCYRASRSSDRPAEELLAATEHVLRTLRGVGFGWPRVVERAGADGLRAVFRVYLFEDDLDVRVVPAASGSVLHVRSASRAGRGDLGVNRRRVRALLAALDLTDRP